MRSITHYLFSVIVVLGLLLTGTVSSGLTRDDSPPSSDLAGAAGSSIIQEPRRELRPTGSPLDAMGGIVLQPRSADSDGPALAATTSALAHEPDNVELVSRIEGPTGLATVHGDHIYLWVHEGLAIVDVSDPADPVELGHIRTPTGQVVVAGSHAYVGGRTKLPGNTVPYRYSGWLRVLDVSDPTTPKEIAYLETPVDTTDLTVDGDYVYVLGKRGPNDPRRLQVFDASDPANVHEVAHFEIPAYASRLQVTDGYAYVAEHTGPTPGWLKVFDATRPTDLVMVGHYEGLEWGSIGLGVFPSSDYAYMVTTNPGGGGGWLQVVDIADPTSPTTVGVADVLKQGVVRRVAFEQSGNYVYLAYGRSGLHIVSGLQIVDISDPTNPVEAGHYYTQSSARNVAVSATGEYVYLVESGAELSLLILRFTGHRSAPGAPPADPIADSVTSTPTPGPTAGGRIAYIGPDGNVWLISPDGTAKEQLTADADGDTVMYREPKWSPDGQGMSVCQRDGDLNRLLVLQPGTNRASRISEAETPCYHAWSPDGRSLASVQRTWEGPGEACGSEWMAYREEWSISIASMETGAVVETISATFDMPASVPDPAFDPPRRYFWDLYLRSEQGNWAAYANWDASIPSGEGKMRTVKSGLRWAPAGRWIVLETPSCMLLADYEAGQVTILDPDGAPTCAGWVDVPRQFAFSPGEGLVARAEPPSGILVVSATPLGEPLHRFAGPGDANWPSILGWSRDGEYLFHQWGGFENPVIRTNADLTHPVTVFTGSYGVAFGRLSFSSEGRQIAFSVVTGDPETCQNWQLDHPNPDTHIWVSDIDGSNARRLVEGRQPAWQPSVSTISLDPLLERKRATVAKLRQATVEIMSVPFPIAAFDEQAAEGLIRRVDSQTEQGQLQPSQAESFARVALQEEVIAELLPLYASTAGDLAEIGTDIFAVVLAFNDAADAALSTCSRPGHPLSSACNSTRRMVLRRGFSLLDSLVQFTALSAGGSGAEDLLSFWNVLSYGIGVQLETGKTVQEMLLDTAVKGAAARVLVGQYVDHIQLSLDQGIRSADPTYSGAQATWPTEGALARAEVHARSFPRQASNISQYAHSVHQDVLNTTHLAAAFADLADLATLSPWAAIAQAVKLSAQIMHILTDVYPAYLAVDSLTCTRHLSERAGPLVFNPDQPAPGCTVLSLGGRPSSGMTRQLTRDLQLALPEAMRLQVEGEIADYRTALEEVLLALPDGHAQDISDALASLERLDAKLFASTAQALRISSALAGASYQTLDAYEQANRSSADALQFYLLIAEYLVAPEDERSIDEVEQAGSAVLTDLEILEGALADSGEFEEPGALPVIENIVPRAEPPAGDSADVSVAVRNVGTSDAQEVVVRILSGEGQETEGRISSLRPGEVQTTTVTAKLDGAGRASLVVEISVDGSVTDAGIRRLRAGGTSTTSETAAPAAERSFPQVCSSLPLALLGTALCIGTKRIRIVK